MIQVTHLGGERFYINADQIEYVESVPDTIVFFKSGRKLVIQESAQELAALFQNYKRDTFIGALKIWADPEEIIQ